MAKVTGNKEKRRQWHPAFYGAMHLEFMENKEDLEFTEEKILNTLPLRVDMLIVIKKYPCEIQNEIGKIFQTHNLIEYKSPEDSLNYDVFLKGMAYAYLYKAGEKYVDEIVLEDVTLTFIREKKPVKLLKKLKQEKFDIEEKWPGIYYISKEGFIQIQLIVTKKLSRENHIWLNSLSEKVEFEQAAELLDRTQKLESMDDKNHADSLWEVVATINEDTILEMRRDERMCEALARIMKPELDEAFNNGFDNGYDGGKMEVFKNMLKRGLSKDLAQECANISDELVETALREMEE